MTDSRSPIPSMRRVPTWAVVAAFAATVPVVWLIVASVDVDALGSVWSNMTDNPMGIVIALAAFGAAFGLRSLAWVRVLPVLPLGQSWAGIHVALGVNHVLPLRLGEPLRIVSVAKRTVTGWQEATASTITLRAADIMTIALLGGIAGLGAFSAWWAVGGVVVLGVAGVAAGVVWLVRLSRTRPVKAPGAFTLLLIGGAWVLEAVVIHQVSSWAGLDIGFSGAFLVTAAAVVSQIVAFAPGGIGTYEAGGVAAMVFLGVDPAVGLAVVLSAHAIKTAYSLVFGGIALFTPSPGIFGHLRLRVPDPDAVPPPSPGRADVDRPIVLFMPAYNEAASVAAVVRRMPETVAGHPVVCIVVDDGSTDGTGVIAEKAGALVVTQPENRGLGAAVRTGLAVALEHEPAAVAFCDADGEYAPEELGDLVAPILDGTADYVVGSRFAGDIEHMLPHRRFGNQVLTKTLSWVARQRITDGQSGYRAFSPRAAEAAEVIHDFNYAQVITLDLLGKGMRYVEVPISYHFRTSGESFIKLGRYLRAVVPAVYRELNAPSADERAVPEPG